MMRSMADQSSPHVPNAWIWKVYKVGQKDAVNVIGLGEMKLA